MTQEDIYEFFKDDKDLLKYFDPKSNANNNLEASFEIYNTLVNDFSNRWDCFFKRNEIGYIFYKKGLLLSFCVKPEFRNKENLNIFSNFIRSELGSSFSCYLYSINTRAIRFLEKMGLKKVDSNNLITLLSI
jgi:ribosomal protein S18 acetylase RimI-like enzyme